MDDLIPVRPDETFDTDALTEWMAGQPGLPSGMPRVQQFGGGKANLTYLLTFPDGFELVLRRPPLGPVAKTSHDVGREYRVLSRLWQSFDKAPRAIAHTDDHSIIGSPFFLMERRAGIVVRNHVPEIYGLGADPNANRALSEVVIDTLAELHAVRPGDCGLADLGHPDGFLQRQVDGWRDRWARAQDEPYGIADEVGGWLADNLPASPPATLVHNDWRLDNMAVSPENPGECVAVYDWDMATRGDPLADLGTLMGSWFDPGEAPDGLGMMPTTLPGWMSRSQALARYREVSGRDIADVDWYLVFGSWKLAVILQQIFVRWLRGQTKDARFKALGESARHLFDLAGSRRR